MKITSLEIRDMGGIPYLNFENLNHKVNIICGENGVGKTNILESIAFIFSAQNENIFSKRKNSSSNGLVRAMISSSVGSVLHQRPLNHYGPNGNTFDTYIREGNPFEINQLLFLRESRIFLYKKENQIKTDKKAEEFARKNLSGVDNNDLKNWLIIRQGFSGHNLTETQRINAELAKTCFSVLNSEYTFSRVSTDFEIYINSPNGEIHFEYLSSGFKSTLFILLGLIKELDLRLNGIKSAQDFDGIILIDEIELHLHPEWQGRIVNILKDIFPNAQFFITTHSPHVIQSASAGEVIALEKNGDEIEIRDIPNPEYGYQGWTIEEILEHVMGMPDLRTQKYNQIKSRFDDALEEKNKEKAKLAFDELNKMLHENYPLRPIFQMQLDSLGE